MVGNRWSADSACNELKIEAGGVLNPLVLPLSSATSSPCSGVFRAVPPVGRNTADHEVEATAE